jgi:ferric-dicitrate binding protein FerR (iron transport regulator)
MDKQYFRKLLHKYRHGDLTREERNFLISYYNLFQQEPDVLDSLSAGEKEAFKQEIKQAVWNKIAQTEKPVSKLRYLQTNFVKLAAAAVLFFVLTAALYLSINRRSASGRMESANLPSAQHRENRVIFLPDGSTVILSPGSRLNYPSSFDGMEKREVFLEGQGFFEIRHNVSRPFIVHTGKLKTTVLGTAFNIKALPGDPQITVTVKRGKVRVSDQDNILGDITPNEQISFDSEKQQSVKRKVNDEGYLAWEDRDLFVDNVTISEAAKLLEDQYHVKIIIGDSSISSERFTATFPRKESFEEALKSICLFNGISYRFNGSRDTVLIRN